MPREGSIILNDLRSDAQARGDAREAAMAALAKGGRRK
jgi:hypothetical protein